MTLSTTFGLAQSPCPIERPRKQTKDYRYTAMPVFQTNVPGNSFISKQMITSDINLFRNIGLTTHKAPLSTELITLTLHGAGCDQLATNMKLASIALPDEAGYVKGKSCFQKIHPITN